MSRPLPPFLPSVAPVGLPACQCSVLGNLFRPCLLTMAPSSARQRDLFPLPFLEECPLDARAGLCRTTARRVSRKNKSLEAANDAILAINQLGGRGEHPSSLFPPPAIATVASQRIGEIFLKASPPPADLPSPEGALRELLGASGLYEGAGAHVAPYAKDKVSWPEVGSSPMALVDGLPQADSERLTNWASHMLRDPSEAEALRAKAGLRRAHCDPDLFSSPAVYADFCRQLMARNLIRLSKAASRKGDLGFFRGKGVTKSDL